ncbi:hypothetical protein [Veillonella magna]|uniref:hypothetical protein n=1 Tax=Veillonella magna TaxID=464322 RepID=UPI00048A393B|nr:hypothetical protein [Veillonella magna]
MESNKKGPQGEEALKKLVYISVFGNILSVILILLGSQVTDVRYTITVTLYIFILLAVFPYQWIVCFVHFLKKLSRQV